MKKITSIFAAMVLVAMLAIPASAAMAQNAAAQTWTSAIHYMSPGTSAGSLTVNFYAGATVYSSSAIGLAAKQSGELLVGNVGGLPQGFQGSAVLSSDVPIVATYRQFVSGAEQNNYARSFYNAFTASEAATTFYVPTAQKKAFSQQQDSRIGIQNVGSSSVDATLQFINTSNVVIHTINTTIPAQASYVFRMADIPNANIPVGFSGSLKITATGPVVAVSAEEWFAGRRAYAFEGVSSGANTVYVATAMCDVFATIQRSNFAIQAIGGTANNVTVKYYNTAGALVGTDNIGTLGDGQKATRNPCMVVSPGFFGSAVVTSTGAGLSVIAKIATNAPNTDMTTAYNGQATGALVQALPFVRWPGSNLTTGFRTNIAVQNISGSNATNIVATYYNLNGTVAGTHTLASGGSPLPPLIKANTSPCMANIVGAQPACSGTFNGSVIITSDQPVVVTARVAINSSNNQFGEDYVGIGVP